RRMPRAVSSSPLPPPRVALDETQLLGCTHMQVCPGCGTTAASGRFCPACGAVLADPPPGVPARATATPEHDLFQRDAAEAQTRTEDTATANTDERSEIAGGGDPDGFAGGA